MGFWTGAGVALLMLGLAETGARLLLRAQRRFRVYRPGLRLHLRLDPEVFPGMEPLVRLEFNQEGERGDPPPAPGSAGVFRGLVAGGSAAECYFLDQPTSWPGALARLLSEPEALARLGAARVHLGNLARSLFGARQLDLVFEKVLPHHPPLDLIVLMVGATDVVKWLGEGAPERPIPPTLDRDQIFDVHPGIRLGWTPRRSGLAELARRVHYACFRPLAVRENAGRTLAAARRMRARALEIRGSIPDSTPMLDGFEEAFRRVLRRAAAASRRVLVVHQPCFDREHTPEEEARFWGCGIGDPYHQEVTVYYSFRVVAQLMELMNTRAARAADEAGIERLDLMPLLERSLETYYDFFHFTPAGASRVAAEIARVVLAAPGPPRGGAAHPPTPPGSSRAP